MQKHVSTIVAILIAVLYIPHANSDSIDHFNADANTSVSIDDSGGEEDGYTFVVNGVDHLSTRSGPILWDGTNYYNGPEREDYSAGGITLNDPSSIPGFSEDSIANFTAGPFAIQQTTFVVDGGRFVIHQWLVTNTSGSPVDAKLLLAEDWDVGESSSSNTAGYDASRILAYQQNPRNFSAAGTALLAGTFDNYYLGNCCDITYDSESDGDTVDYMNGIITGDVSNGGGGRESDKEVGVSADLGTLAAGAGACSRFVSAAVGEPESLAEGLLQLQAEVDAAIALNASLPACGTPPAEVAAIAIPTMSQWALILLSILLALSVCVGRRHLV